MSGKVPEGTGVPDNPFFLSGLSSRDYIRNAVFERVEADWSGDHAVHGEADSRCASVIADVLIASEDAVSTGRSQREFEDLVDMCAALVLTTVSECYMAHGRRPSENPGVIEFTAATIVNDGLEEMEADVRLEWSDQGFMIRSHGEGLPSFSGGIRSSGARVRRQSMTGFFFQGVQRAPNGDFVPSFPISESAYRRIRERWSTLQLTGPNGEPIVGQQRDVILEETVLDDALWQFWLSNDLASWQTMPMDEKLWFLSHCVRDGRWWREWATENIEFGSWLWQKRLAFERTAVRESINAESPTPAAAIPDATRQVVAANMVRWHEDLDLRNPNMSPYDIPESYVGLVFETI